VSRIPRVTKHDDMPAERQHFFDRIIRTRGRVTEPFQVLLNSPEIADRLASIGDFLLFDTVVAPPVRTLTWLIAAREYDCEYAWAAAVPLARKAGVQENLIDAIWNRKPLPDVTHEQQLLIDFCHQLLRGNHHVSERSYRATVDHFGIAATVQIAATVGYFVMMAFVFNAFEIQPNNAESEPLL